jgi:pimeloyl-ACP methyl ester carboxylesterase
MLELPERARTSRGEIAFGAFGEGPPVVLVHGTPSRAAVWRNVIPVLARSHRVYAFDMVGFGDSDRELEQDVSVAAHGRVLAELIEGWGLEAPALVGHDIGGATLLRAHLLEGAPAGRIALIDAVVLAPWITDRTRRMQTEPPPDHELGEAIREHLNSATVSDLDPDAYDALFGQWDGEEGRALYLRNLACFDENDTEEFRPLLGQLRAPVLVVWGEQDAWLPVEVSERIEAAIPGAERIVLEVAGHFSMEDRPEAVAEALERFLS